jgi:hypothetical protein
LRISARQGVASAYELKAKHDNVKGSIALAKEDMLKVISFYEKQGMMERADSLRKDSARDSDFHLHPEHLE